MRTAKWKYVGKDVSQAKTAQECMEIAGLDYQLELRKMYVAGKNEVDGIPVIGQCVPNSYAVTRIDNNMPLAVVGNRYNIIQNGECFGFFDGLVEQGIAKYTSAGSTYDGRKVHVVADLGDFDIGGDKGNKRIILRTAHDGSQQVTYTLEVGRLICTNGLMGWKTSRRASVKHTRSYREQMAEARQVIGIAQQYYKWFEAEAKKLAETVITPTKAREFIAELLPAKKDEKNNEQLSTRIENARDQMFTLFRSGMGNHGRTKWDLYNGIVEYIDHYRSTGRNDEKKFESDYFGSGANLKVQAFEDLAQSAFTVA